MKIGILGTGHIGTTLTQRLSAAGHDVKVANSRGPETIGLEVLASGGRAVLAAEAVIDVDVVILSVPLHRLPQLAPLLTALSSGTVVIDTSNYYPQRDGRIEPIEAAQDRAVGMALVEDTGFDAFDAGPLAQSWRQQPGTPCYCTDLTLEEMPEQWAAADARRSPTRRDLAVAAIQERVGDATANPDAEYGVRLNRALFT